MLLHAQLQKLKLNPQEGQRERDSQGKSNMETQWGESRSWEAERRTLEEKKGET